jgi:hypothetical protein
MLSLIGFVFLWPICITIIVIIFNTFRAKMGININDSLTQLLQGAVLGPLGILFGLFPFNLLFFLGGCLGTYWAYQIYQAL